MKHTIMGTIVLILGTCLFPCALPAQEPLAIDTTAIVLRVANNYPRPVRVYVEPFQAPRRKVSDVSPKHEGLFLLPSSDIRKIIVFVVIVEADSIAPYRTGFITRNPTRMTMVYIVVGPQDSVAALPPRAALKVSLTS